MKIKHLKVLFSVLFAVILSIITYTIVAQSSISVGCNTWNGFGTLVRDPNTRTGLHAQALNAGEVLRVSFTLHSATNATANLESPSNVPINQQSFTSGSVSFSFVVPADGNYSVFGANDASSNGSINVTFSCQAASSGSSNSISSPPVAQGFNDGRINYLDAAAPIVVYPYQDDTGAGFDVYSAQGNFLMRATGADLANGPMFNPNSNIAVTNTAGGGYRVTAPQYNGKLYILQFAAPFANIGYTSWEQD